MGADPTTVFEFEAVVGHGGVIRLPAGNTGKRRPVPGTRVTVRVLPSRYARNLRKRGIPEDEVARIATLQMETRERVLELLMAEGSLAGRRPRRPRRVSRI